MKKIFLILSLFVLFSCSSKLDPENAKQCVLKGEQDYLPLLLQRLENVNDITLDSMRIHCDEEPMDGFLYTTWTINKKKWNRNTWKYENYIETKSIIIKVDSIRQSTTHKGYIEWQTDWARAYEDVML